MQARVFRLFGVMGLLLGAGLAQAQETTAQTVPVFEASVEAAGDVLLLYGKVVNTQGQPVTDAVVEIWQADSLGYYDHSNAPSTEQMDVNFQHYGAVITDAAGNYAFRTVVPALEGFDRPLHIHVKVKINDVAVLTTQFYFVDDLATAQQDQIFNQIGDAAEAVLLTLVPVEDAVGNILQTATKDLVLNLGEVGTLTETPAQTEGPYYPQVTVAEYDNDLAVVSEQPNPANTTEAAVSFSLFNLNTVTSDELMTIPDFSRRMVREFEEYRPYVSISQFRREIGKYVDDAQITAWEAYVYVPVDPNNADAATLMQIPGVDETVATALMAARPFASNEAFLTTLADYLTPAQVQLAAYYLVGN